MGVSAGQRRRGHRHSAAPGWVFISLPTLSHPGPPNKNGEAETSPRNLLPSRLIAGRNGCRLDVDAFAVLVEMHLAVRQGEQGPVAAGADIFAGDKFGAALADQNAAGSDEFAAEAFYTESFADAIAPVADAAAAFLVCHKKWIVES